MMDIKAHITGTVWKIEVAVGEKVDEEDVVMILESIYEQDFMDWSYGFRPGRSAHQALESTWSALTKMGGGWVLEVDIKSFFDELDHGHLRDFVRKRVRDGVLLRLIGKWLKAGVLEDGSIQTSTKGTPDSTSRRAIRQPCAKPVSP